MALPTERYFLDETDLANFKCVVLTGLPTILQFPKRKEVYAHDWKDENGLEYDLDNAPLYEDKELELDCLLIAEGEADFWTNYNGLLGLINKTGWVDLYCAEADTALEVFYRSSSTPEQWKRIRSEWYIMQFKLYFTAKHKPFAEGDGSGTSEEDRPFMINEEPLILNENEVFIN